MTRRPCARRPIAAAVAAGALVTGFTAATLSGVFTASGAGTRAATVTGVGSAPPTAAAPNPYFLCIAYQAQWGICVGPPTN